MIRVSVGNGERVKARLRKVGSAAQEEVDKALLQGAVMIEGEAKTRIQRGPKTGAVYTRGAVSHRASAPGESPATDTGHLVSSISHWILDNGKRVLVGTRLLTGRLLEYGTSRIAPRPWLYPSLEACRAKIKQLLAAALAKAVAK